MVNFADVSYISSAGFRVLLLAHRHAVTHNSVFAVGGAQPLVMEIFSISRSTRLSRATAACAMPSPHMQQTHWRTIPPEGRAR